MIDARCNPLRKTTMNDTITEAQFAALCAAYDAEQDYLDALEANKAEILKGGDAADRS